MKRLNYYQVHKNKKPSKKKVKLAKCISVIIEYKNNFHKLPFNYSETKNNNENVFTYTFKK